MEGIRPVGLNALVQILDKETGARRPRGIPRYVCLIVPLLWTLFQLWIISPLPYSLGVGVFNDTATRSIHLSFAIFIAYLYFPMLKSSSRNVIPFTDWVLAAVAAFCASYLFLFQAELVQRPGIPTTLDVVVSYTGILLLLEATRRVMGLPMTVIASIFIVYVFVGPYAPDLIAHRGASLSRAASQFWLTTEGVFGVPLGVSVAFVFLYVLFGAMLEKAGAGNYLTTLSFAVLGHLRGGPAKAAVVASGLHGIISGSSIANVLTCGPVTIMLMKRVGFSSEKAGAVEVAAGSNGQIMPPVMGAAAFLMIEYINMPYEQLLKHAFVPAILAYASLLYIVHLEACKMGMQGTPRNTPVRTSLLGAGLTLCSLLILTGLAYFLTFWIPEVFGAFSGLVFGLLLAGAYLGLLFASTRFPELPESPDELMKLPAVFPTLRSGIYFFLPIAVLVWCLMILHLSPGLAAFYACVFMAFILVTKGSILAFLRKQQVLPALRDGAFTLLASFVAGARNMVGIALATATAGIIVGAVSLTGIGQVLAAVVETISMGYFPLVLVMTAMLSLVLGIGLPTTANYIIVSTLLAPVIYNLGASYGMAVPLVAVHLFCLYFGVMADATPPVALAAFAAAGISGGDPLKTGLQGFFYEMRTAVLPFVFVYNPELLLINVTSAPQLVWVVGTAALACMCFASATQRFLLTKSRFWEVALLLVAMIFLFRPGIAQDFFYDPYTRVPAAKVQNAIEEIAPEGSMRLIVSIDSGNGVKEKVIAFPVTEGDALQRLEKVGLFVEPGEDKLAVVDVAVNSRAEKLGLDIANDNYITGIEVPSERPSKYWFNLPGIFIFMFVYAVHWRRRRAENKATCEAVEA